MTTTTNKPIRIGVIGAGFIAQVAHLSTFSRLEDACVVAIAEPHDELREAVADRYRISAAFSNYEDLLDSSDVDAYVISLPRRAQSVIVSQALLKSRPVLSEKPMAMTLEEATQMVAVTKRVGVNWMVGYMKRYDLGVQRFAHLLKGFRTNGELGPILDVSMHDFCGSYGVSPPEHIRRKGPRLNRYPESRCAPDYVASELCKDYEYTVNVASHDINLLRLFFGDIQPSAFWVRPGLTQRAMFGADGFAINLAVAPAELGRWDQRVEVIFSLGRMVLSLPSPLSPTESARILVEKAGSVEQITVPAAEHLWAFEGQARAFVQSAKTGIEATTSATSSLGDLAIVDRLWKMVKIHG